MTDSDAGHDNAIEFITDQELAALTGLNVRVVRRLTTLQVIEPAVSSPAPRFHRHTALRVRKMRRLHVELGVSWTSMPLVMQLLERIDQLEAHLRNR